MMTHDKHEADGPVERMLKRVPEPASSSEFVETVMRRLPEPRPAEALRPAWRPWWLIQRWSLGFAAAALVMAIVQQQPAVGTEALLLGDWPVEASWAFASESPDADMLLGMEAP